MTRARKDKWCVYGEYGGYFTNLKDAKQCAKESSTMTDSCGYSGEGLVWLVEDGCNYIEYKNGKLVRDGWTIKK